MASERTSVGCACTALVAYGLALASVVHGYRHALDTSCPDGAAAPAAFWPLVAVSVVLAGVAFMTRPRRRNEHGARSGANVLAVAVVVAVPLAALATVFGYEFTYACWE